MPEGSSPVVVNTGPLIALGACGQVDLLRSLHSGILVPEAVAAELRRLAFGGQGKAAWESLPDWVEVCRLRAAPAPLLLAHLDDGEAAAIALALERGIRLVVIDERRGRLVARTLGLSVTGSVGVLLRAKRKGLLAAVRPCLEAMRAKGVWLSARLVEFALTEAGES